MVQKTSTFGLTTSDVVALTQEQRESSSLIACVSISQEPETSYKNFKPARFEGFYGYCQLMCGDFVQKTIKLGYLNQVVLEFGDDSFYSLDTLICIGKELALLSNGTLTDYALVKPLCSTTALRFRFVPGCLANIVLNWQPVQSVCGNTLANRQPDELQSPQPNNHQWIPGSQPSDTQEDPNAPSVNDGDTYPDDDHRPPYAEIVPLPGQWIVHVTYSAAPPSSGSDGDRDPTSIWTAGGVCHEGVPGRTDPNGNSGIGAYKNGTFQYCAQNPSKGAVTSLSFEWVPDATP